MTEGKVENDFIFSREYNPDQHIGIDLNICNKDEFIFSFVISVNEQKSEEMKRRLEKNYFFIKPKKFPFLVSDWQKQYMVYESHIDCIKTALNMNLDHAFIFEDDVIFVRNWRDIVNEFISTKKVDIIKFDRLPYRFIENKTQDQKVYFYQDPKVGCCIGGYYLSKYAMKVMLDRHNLLLPHLENHPETNAESLWGHASQPIRNTTYFSMPMICIQDWYNQNQSSTQTNNYLETLSNMQKKYYLPLCGHYYPEYEKNN